MPEKDPVTIIVPSSSANVGPFYDIGCVGLEKPNLSVTYRARSGQSLTEIISSVHVPTGRSLGKAGIKALYKFHEAFGIDSRFYMLMEDSGYPVGGLGRSGAEAVGAVMAAAVYHHIPLTREQVIEYSAKGEPDEHKDNVAGSTNGRFNLISRSPVNDSLRVTPIDPPIDLGIAIGFSSHQKTEGTEGMRAVLQEPVSAETFIKQMGRLAIVTDAMRAGDTETLLEYILGDLFHEQRRANIGGYGNFNAVEFTELKKYLHKSHGVALNVSGAGPNMQFLYNKVQYPYPEIILERLAETAGTWFADKGIKMKIREMEIARGGAYDYALENYPDYRALVT